LLSFANVYFFESGLFNGLRPIQIKKIFSVLSPVVGGGSGWLRGHLNHFFTSAISAADPAPRSTVEFAIAEHDSGHFCLTQENVDHVVNRLIPFAGSKL
jgi:hypothetical protein